MKYKYLFIAISIILLSNLFFATIIDEKTLNSIDKGDFVVDKGKEMCRDYMFSIEQDQFSESYLQLKLKNYIPVNQGVSILLKINDQNLSFIENKDLKERNIVHIKEIKETNKLEICVKNDFLPRMVIDGDSLVGSYYNPRITEEDFYQEAPAKSYIDTLIPITVVVKNSGYKDTFIELYNASNLFIYNSNLENVSGQTSYEGVLKAQNEIRINYFIKTDRNNMFATPIAMLKYKDVFGEEIEKKIKPQIINIYSKENVLENHIDVEKTIRPLKEQIGHLIIRNDSETEVRDVYIKPHFNGEVIISKERINIINPKDVIEIPFTIKTYKEGAYNLSFTIDYLEGLESKNVGTQIIKIASENKETSQNTAITILLIITIFLFIWIVKI